MGPCPVNGRCSFRIKAQSHLPQTHNCDFLENVCNDFDYVSVIYEGYPAK
jgi:hypothetical protein